MQATGSGKSLTFQVPPLAVDGVALVISPLISLMEDQVAALNARGIPAAFLGSAQASPGSMHRALPPPHPKGAPAGRHACCYTRRSHVVQSDASVKEAAWRGKYKLVYLTPELAANATDRLVQLRQACRVVLVAVDEAHSVSEMGHDFRPEYRRLAQLREALGPSVPMLAVTATATLAVQRDITTSLQMRNPQRWARAQGTAGGWCSWREVATDTMGRCCLLARYAAWAPQHCHVV